jgi:hypothetical protein
MPARHPCSRKGSVVDDPDLVVPIENLGDHLLGDLPPSQRLGEFRASSRARRQLTQTDLPCQLGLALIGSAPRPITRPGAAPPASGAALPRRALMVGPTRVAPSRGASEPATRDVAASRIAGPEVVTGRVLIRERWRILIRERWRNGIPSPPGARTSSSGHGTQRSCRRTAAADPTIVASPAAAAVIGTVAAGPAGDGRTGVTASTADAAAAEGSGDLVSWRIDQKSTGGSSGPPAASPVVWPTPSFSRIFFSISAATSGFSLRNSRAFSLP